MRAAAVLLLLASACGAAAGGPDVGDTADALEVAAPDVASDVAPETTPAPEPLRVMTFNVLCFICDPSYDEWDARLEYFRDIFARHDPDLIGLQELFLPSDVDDILARLPHAYAALYYPGTDVFKPYPDATLFYRTDRFEELEHGFYWLSPTPDDPMTTGFAESQLVRLVAWVHLRRLADGRELTFATMHVDNNAPSQQKSAPLILARAEPWAAARPTVVTGDFNSNPSTVAYQTLVNGVDGQGFRFDDAYVLAPEHVEDATLDPPPDYSPEHRIDHVFLSGAQWSCPRWTVDLHKYGDNVMYPSDHRSIMVECAF